MIFHFVVAISTLEPLFAAARADRNLNVENVFAHQFNLNV